MVQLNRILAACALGAVTLFVSANANAESVYVTMKGQKSGEIKGGVTLKGHENSILVYGVSHDISVPRDPQSGLPTGQRVHTPFVLTAHVDQAMPILYQVLTTNENLSVVTVEFWGDASNGSAPEGGFASAPVHLYTVTLTNASIVDMSLSETNPTDLTTRTPPATLNISLTYQKIEWDWIEGGIVAGDDWEARS